MCSFKIDIYFIVSSIPCLVCLSRNLVAKSEISSHNCNSLLYIIFFNTGMTYAKYLTSIVWCLWALKGRALLGLNLPPRDCDIFALSDLPLYGCLCHEHFK